MPEAVHDPVTAAATSFVDVPTEALVEEPVESETLLPGLPPEVLMLLLPTEVWISELPTEVPVETVTTDTNVDPDTVEIGVGCPD